MASSDKPGPAKVQLVARGDAFAGTSLRHQADFRFAYAMSMPTARGLRANPSAASDGAAVSVRVFRHESRRGGGFGRMCVDFDTWPPHPGHLRSDRMTSSPVPPAPVGCLPVPGGGQKFGVAAMRAGRGVDVARYWLSLRTAERMQRCLLASLDVIGRVRKECGSVGHFGRCGRIDQPAPAASSPGCLPDVGLVLRKSAFAVQSRMARKGVGGTVCAVQM